MRKGHIPRVKRAGKLPLIAAWRCLNCRFLLRRNIGACAGAIVLLSPGSIELKHRLVAQEVM